LSQEVFGHDREVADSAPGDVEDGVGDGGRDADGAEFADALAAQRADVGSCPSMKVTSIGGISVGGDDILVQAGVEQPCGGGVGCGGFEQGLARCS